MRIESVRRTPVRELEKKGEVPKWVLRREFRSSYRDHLNATETIVAGEWFKSVPDPNGPASFSLETEIARDLGVTVGDELTLDVQSVPVRARITSLRKVDWSRFNLNFFMIFPPGVLGRCARFPRRDHAGAGRAFLRGTAARTGAEIPQRLGYLTSS